MTDDEITDERVKDMAKLVCKVETAIHRVVRTFARDIFRGKGDENEDLFAIWYALIRYAARVEAARNLDCGCERFDADLIYQVYSDAYDHAAFDVYPMVRRAEHDWRQ